MQLRFRAVPLLVLALLVGAPCLDGRCLPPAVAQETAAKAEATGTLYHFGTSVARTSIQFESETELETIHGVTHTMSGTSRFDWDAGTATAKLIVPVKDLKTGMDKRDEHLMTETWLDAAKHPEIVFEATKLVRDEKDTKTWHYEGTLTIKGTSRELKGDARVINIPASAGKALGPGEWVKVKTGFKVKLADFGIEIPNATVAAKVEDTWTIKVDIFGTTAAPKKR